MKKNVKIINHPCFNEDGKLINEIVKHFKYDMNKNKDPLKYLYRIIEISNDRKNPKKRYVIYETVYKNNTLLKSGENKILIREYNKFFSKIDKNKYPNALQEYRFEPVAIWFLWEKQAEYYQLYISEVK